MPEVKVMVDHHDRDGVVTHSTSSTYEKEEGTYCPNCGKSGVWAEQGCGDYYCGVDYICVACGCIWTMPTFRVAGSTSDNLSNDTDVQTVEALRAHA